MATAFPDAQGEVWITDELQPCEHLWQCSDAQLVNRHFRDFEEWEEVQMAHCALLQHQPELVSSIALRRPINKRCNGMLPTVHSY